MTDGPNIQQPHPSEQVEAHWFSEFFYSKATAIPWLPRTVMLIWALILTAQILFHFVLIPYFGPSAATIYGAIASATGSLLGFLVTAATIFLTIPQENHWHRFAENGLLRPLFRTFMRAIVVMAMALVGSLIGMMLPPGKTHHLAEYIIECLCLILLTVGLSFLAQTVRILAVVGGKVLKRVEKDATDKNTGRLTDIQKRTGPPGSV